MKDGEMSNVYNRKGKVKEEVPLAARIVDAISSEAPIDGAGHPKNRGSAWGGERLGEERPLRRRGKVHLCLYRVGRVSDRAGMPKSMQTGTRGNKIMPASPYGEVDSNNQPPLRYHARPGLPNPQNLRPPPENETDQRFASMYYGWVGRAIGRALPKSMQTATGGHTQKPPLPCQTRYSLGCVCVCVFAVQLHREVRPES